MEKLAKYLKDRNETRKSFSKRSGVSESSLCRILKGEILPGLQSAVQIQKATRGKVKPQDWLEVRATQGETE